MAHRRLIRLGRRLGRRGGLLLLLAVLWVGVAAQVAATNAPYDVDAAVLHERLPVGWRVGLWLASALIMAAAAPAPRRREGDLSQWT